LPNDIESIFIELNFRRNKWLLMGTYHPPSQSTEYYYNEVGKVLDELNNTYENILLIGDFNEK
jgi:endonuclease/exonuclease/phosphatase (EEP) superfamily protein YafD